MKPGQSKLYRPVPNGFVEVFVRVGWGGITREYRVHARTVKRWIDICGRERLVQMRAEHVRQQREARKTT